MRIGIIGGYRVSVDYLAYIDRLKLMFITQRLKL